MGWVAAAVGAALTAGCVATTRDLSVTNGKMSYLETRVERNESLMKELGGVARSEAIESRREMSVHLAKTQKQTAALLVRVQALTASLEALRGRVSELESEIETTQNDLLKSRSAVTSVSQAVSAVSVATEWQTEDDLYQAARKSYQANQFKLAHDRFALQISRWPKGKLIGNAHFWLGQVYLKQKDYLAGIGEFLTVIESYKRSPKRAAAYLKMAESLTAIGEQEQAERTYHDLVKLFPKSDQATVARGRLKQKK